MLRPGLILGASLLMAGCLHRSSIPVPLFFDREVVKPGSTRARLLLTNAPPIPDGIKRRHRSVYNALNAETGLFIHDCSLSRSGRWCDDPDLSFQQIVKKAAQYANVGAEDTFTQWVDDANADPARGLTTTLQTHGYHGTLASAPLQLLAVVNRLDLGQWDSGQNAWLQPEVRFIYGIRGNETGDPPSFGLILEFVIPKLTWTQYRLYAKAWQDLSAGTNFTTGLTKVALGSLAGASLVRLRTNSSLVGASLWTFGQWEFDSVNHFRRRPLTDQIDQGCLLENKPCPAYQTVWTGILAASSTATSFPIDPLSGLLAMKAGTALTYCNSVPNHSVGMSVPTFVTGTYRNPRNILSLQQCIFCHAQETDQNPPQVSNRQPSQNVAQLSPFLSGSGDSSKPNIHPDYDKLANHDPTAGYSAQVIFKLLAQSTTACNSSDPQITRIFNDVARRTLFLAAILAGNDDSAPDEGQISLMQLYAPDFTH
jgi:hypothetical protein